MRYEWKYSDWLNLVERARSKDIGVNGVLKLMLMIDNDSNLTANQWATLTNKCNQIIFEKENEQ